MKNSRYFLIMLGSIVASLITLSFIEMEGVAFSFTSPIISLSVNLEEWVIKLIVTWVVVRVVSLLIKPTKEPDVLAGIVDDPKDVAPEQGGIDNSEPTLKEEEKK